jgi:hypothetical protein
VLPGLFFFVRLRRGPVSPFHPHPGLSPSGALQIAKSSRDLSPLLSNEEFIKTYEDAANARKL